jgi:hypothetical protein
MNNQTSVEKVHQLIAELHQLDASQLDSQTQMALSAILLLRGQLVGLVPDDPDQLDALLLRGAMWALSMRSDDLPPIYLADSPPAIVDADHGELQ